jgi:hypothetical protein
MPRLSVVDLYLHSPYDFAAKHREIYTFLPYLSKVPIMPHGLVSHNLTVFSAVTKVTGPFIYRDINRVAKPIC